MKNLHSRMQHFSPRLAGLALTAAVSLAAVGCGNFDDQHLVFDTRQLAVGGDAYHDAVNDDGDWIKVCDNDPSMDPYVESQGTLETWEEWALDCINGGAAPPPGTVGVIYECSTTAEVMSDTGDRTDLRIFQGKCKEAGEGTLIKHATSLLPTSEPVGRTGRDADRVGDSRTDLKRDDGFDAWGSDIYVCRGTDWSMLASKGAIAFDFFESKCRHAGSTVLRGTVEQGSAPAPRARGMAGRGDVSVGPADVIHKEIDRGNRNGEVWYKCVETGDIMWHSEGIHAYNDFVADCNAAGGTISTGITWFGEPYITNDSSF